MYNPDDYSYSLLAAWVAQLFLLLVTEPFPDQKMPNLLLCW